MKRKKAVIGCMMGMVVLAGLTACQKADSERKSVGGQVQEANSSGQAQEAAGEAAQNAVQETETSSKSGNGSLLESMKEKPEYQACIEYQAFCAGYDTDGTVLEQAGNEPVEAEYEAYNCYSPEMEQKIDEICEKYGLSKLGGFDVGDYKDVCAKLGIGEFCGTSPEKMKASGLYGYLYNDGTFKLEGSITVADSEIYVYEVSFMRAAKGSFNDFFYLDELTEENVREYITKNGETTLLVNKMNPCIIVEREKSFIKVDVLSDFMDVEVTDEMMEILADAFDFTAIP